MKIQNPLKYSSLLILVIIIFPVLALAQGLDFSDYGVDVDGDSVNIVTDDGLSVATDGNAVDIVGADNMAVSTSDSGDIEVRTDEVEVSVTPEATRAVINTSDTEVKIDAGAVEVNSIDNSVRVSDGGSVMIEDENTVMKIVPGGEMSIKTDNDVVMYGTKIVTDSEVISEVKVFSDGVAISYLTQGKFLGLFSVGYDARVLVGVDGNVEISKPWYSFLIFGDTTEIIENAVEAQIATQVITGDAITLKAEYVDIVSGVLEAQVMADGSMSASVDGMSATIDGDDMQVEVDGEVINLDDALGDVDF